MTMAEKYSNIELAEKYSNIELAIDIGIDPFKHLENHLRVGNWIMTCTGRRVYVVDPRPEDYHIDDIAAGLGNICRYNGQIPAMNVLEVCQTYYSVAQHSVTVAMMVPDGFKRAALLHDASEAYIGDVARPLKHYLTEYQNIERSMMFAIYSKFGIDPYLIDSKIVKAADNTVLMAEAKHLGFDVTDWGIPELETPTEVMDIIRRPMDAHVATLLFEKHFEQYFD